MSEYDEERFYYNNENDEFQSGLPNILRDNIYSNGKLPSYLNDLSASELIAMKASC